MCVVMDWNMAWQAKAPDLEREKREDAQVVVGNRIERVMESGAEVSSLERPQTQSSSEVPDGPYRP